MILRNKALWPALPAKTEAWLQGLAVRCRINRRNDTAHKIRKVPSDA